MENSKTDLITVINSILVLLDYQTRILNQVESGDKKEIKNSVIASARAAQMLDVPVVFTSVNTRENGEFLKELSDMFPGKEVIERTESLQDAFEDKRVLSAIKKSRRDKVIISGLWTSKCFANTALHGISEGYDVYGLIDASGDTSYAEHNSGVRIMLEAGITPLTWMSLTSEWMNGWANPIAGESNDEIFGKYNTMLSYLPKQQPLRHYK